MPIPKEVETLGSLDRLRLLKTDEGMENWLDEVEPVLLMAKEAAQTLKGKTIDEFDKTVLKKIIAGLDDRMAVAKLLFGKENTYDKALSERWATMMYVWENDL